MSRKYSRDHYLQLAGKIKATMPDVVLTTDIIVGFPGETDEQFEETMTLYEEVGFDFAFTFIYSPRVGTPAAEMEDNVPMEVKKQRLYRLNELVNKLSKDSNERLWIKPLKYWLKVKVRTMWMYLPAVRGRIN